MMNDEEEEEVAERAGLAALEERRREINAKLRTVVNSLKDAGAVVDGFDAAYFLEPPPPEYPNESIHDRLFRRHVEVMDEDLWNRINEESFAFDAPDRERVTWRITSLGREKCAQLWSTFDFDQDDAWSYKEFIEYMTALEELSIPRPGMHAFTDRAEVWRMYMSDLVGLNDSQQLTFEGFLRYRESVEDKSPLVTDLALFGISCEYRAVERVRRVVRLFDEYADPDGAVAIKHLQFLLMESDVYVLYQELWHTVQHQRLFHRCHRTILAQKRALRLFGYRQRSSLQLTSPALENDSRVCRAGFLSLVLSSWMPSQRTWWREWALRSRLRLYARLRTWKRDAADMFTWIRKATKTGLLSVNRLQSTAERELGDYVFKLEIGPNFVTHATISLNYYSDADSAATLHELAYLERGAECFVFIDFMCRSGTRERDVQWLSQRFTWFIETFLQEHIQLLPFFYKWFVTIPSKMQLRAGSGGGGHHISSRPGDGAVVRVVILFTSGVDLFEVMRSLNLPSSMQFDHLLQRFSMRWLFSHSLEDILTSKRFVAGEQWSCRGQVDVRFNRQAWGQIFEQVAMQMRDHGAMEREEQVYMAHEREKAQTTERKEGKHANGTATAAATTSSHAAQGHAANNVVGSDNARSAAGSAANSLNNVIPPNKPQERLYRFARWLATARELSVTWTFRILGELLVGNKWIDRVLTPSRHAYLEHQLFTAGALASEWKRLGDSFRAEFATSAFVQRVLAATNTPQDDANPGIGSEGIPLEKKKSVVSGSLSVSGGIPDSGIPPDTDKTMRPLDEEGIDKDPEDPVESDLLELYEACVKHLMALHTVRAEAGTSGVCCVVDGWNLFPVLPRVVPTTGRRTSNVPMVGRKKSSQVESQ